MIGHSILRAVLAATLLVVGSACSPATRAPSSDDAPLPAVRLGLLPIVDVAPVYLAIEEGLFAAEGIEVRVEFVQGGAAAIPALVSGDLDIAYGNWVSFILAANAGIEVRGVAGGVVAAPGFTEILARADSGLTSNPAGLAGGTVAVNTLRNIGELAVIARLAAAGLAPNDVTLVEIPFPEMPDALARGDVDAIWASEPIPTLAKSDHAAVVVTDSFVGDLAEFPVAGYQTTKAYAERQPGLVAAFARAIAEASRRLAADPGRAATLVSTYTSLPTSLADEISLPAYDATLEAATLRRVVDALHEHDLLDSDVDVERLIHRGSSE